MSIWKTATDTILGTAGTSSSQLQLPDVKEMYDRYLRDQYMAAQGINATVPMKRFPTMWIDHKGDVTLMGQLMIRLKNGQVGLETGAMITSAYKGVEIIDVRKGIDGISIYVAVKNKDPFIIKDEPDLFPSDRLIGQFKVLAGD